MTLVRVKEKEKEINRHISQVRAYISHRSSSETLDSIDKRDNVEASVWKGIVHFISTNAVQPCYAIIIFDGFFQQKMVDGTDSICAYSASTNAIRERKKVRKKKRTVTHNCSTQYTVRFFSYT